MTTAAIELDAGRDAGTSVFKRWWFTPEAPLNLGICRVLFYGLELAYHADIRLPEWGNVPMSLYKPVWLFERLHLPVLSPGSLLVFEIVWKLALLFSCLGFLTRISTVVAALGTAYLLGLPFNFGKVYHMSAIVVFTSAILAFSQCGAAVSIDALLRRKRGLPALPPSGEYRWPVRMVWVLMGCLFLNAGMAKVIHGGTEWALGENMAILLVQRQYQNDNALPFLNWGLFIAKHKILYSIFAGSSMVIETAGFLAIFIRYPWKLVLPMSLLGMQIGIGLLMRVWFTPFMIVYLFWIPWGDILRWMAARRTKLNAT